MGYGLNFNHFSRVGMVQPSKIKVGVSASHPHATLVSTFFFFFLKKKKLLVNKYKG
jgi:hypothetical protein